MPIYFALGLLEAETDDAFADLGRQEQDELRSWRRLRPEASLHGTMSVRVVSSIWQRLSPINCATARAMLSIIVFGDSFSAGLSRGIWRRDRKLCG
jgi:hypothetical protein